MFNQICKSHFAIKYEVILPCWTLGYHQIEIEQSPILTNGCRIHNFSLQFLLAWILGETSAYSKDKSLLISRKSDAKKNMEKKSVNSTNLQFSEVNVFR